MNILPKISKKFSDKVMNTIESNSEKYATFLSLNAITKVASVFVFAYYYSLCFTI